VEETLRALAAREDEPLVMRLPRQAGQKEARFAHLLSGEPHVEEGGEAVHSDRPTRRAGESDRVAKLEEQVQTLNDQIENLSKQFAEFKKQFE
jgi:uncharacterized protein